MPGPENIAHRILVVDDELLICETVKRVLVFDGHIVETATNGREADVLPGQAAAFTVEGQRIALFNVEGTYYAIADACTHRGGSLSQGDVEGTKVTCLWHAAEFDLKTAPVPGPPPQEALCSNRPVLER